MNDKTPKKSTCKAVADLLGFIHGLIFKRPPTTPPAQPAAHKSLLTIRITLDVEPCCLEAFFAVTQLASLRGVLFGSQQACLGAVSSQIQTQLTPAVQQSIRNAVAYQVEADMRREQRRLFDAAIAATSIN